MIKSKDVFNHIKLGGDFTDIPAASFAEWLTDSRLYLSESGVQLVSEHELELYEPNIRYALEYASTLICEAGMYTSALEPLRQVIVWVWEDVHVLGHDVDYSILESKLELVISKLHRLIKYI